MDVSANSMYGLALFCVSLFLFIVLGTASPLSAFKIWTLIVFLTRTRANGAGSLSSLSRGRSFDSSVNATLPTRESWALVFARAIPVANIAVRSTILCPRAIFYAVYRSRADARSPLDAVWCSDAGHWYPPTLLPVTSVLSLVRQDVILQPAVDQSSSYSRRDRRAETLRLKSRCNCRRASI